MAPEVIRICLEYALCFVIVVASIFCIALFKRRTKREMRAERVKESCIKAKKLAEEMVSDGKNKGTYMLLASTKLSHLSSLVADAAWYAYQIVNGKRNILYEGIATGLDVLATEISTASEDGYIPVKDYRACVEKAVNVLDATIAKIDSMS